MSADPEFVNLLLQLRALDPAADPDQRHQLVEDLYTRYTAIGRGATTPSGLPYPDPTDPVAEGADAIRALAEAIPILATGSRATGGSTAPGAYSDWQINFPAGRFSVAPNVFAIPAGYRFSMSVNSITTIGAILRATNTSTTADTPGTLRWFAIYDPTQTALLGAQGDEET